MHRAAADNDVLYKGAWFGLMRELLQVVPAAPADTLILSYAKYVIGKKLERQKRREIPKADVAMENFKLILAELSPAEPSVEEQLLAADLENAASLAGLALDGGESLLCAVFVCRGLGALVTGDKRAIIATETLAASNERLSCLEGKVHCLEQLFIRMLDRLDPITIRAAVCHHLHVDKALAICFSCGRSDVGIDQWKSGLKSYVDSTRNAAPRVLSRTIP